MRVSMSGHFRRSKPTRATNASTVRCVRPHLPLKALQERVGHTQQRLLRPRHEPVNGAAAHEGWEAPQPVRKPGVLRGQGQHHVQAVPDAGKQELLQRVGRVRLPGALRVKQGPHLGQQRHHLRVAAARRGTAQHSTAQHSTAQHSTAQHSTAQHSTAQHSTAQPGVGGGWVRRPGERSPTPPTCP